MELMFEAMLKKFDSKGEKTGWTYIDIPTKVSNSLGAGIKKSFRVKGCLDEFAIQGVALIPMGDALFILAVNASMRKGIRKKAGDRVRVRLSLDNSERRVNALLLACLVDDEPAMSNFSKLPQSHQMYYSKWIEEAKTEATQIKRIAMTLRAMALHMDFGAMLRAEKANKIN